MSVTMTCEAILSPLLAMASVKVINLPPPKSEPITSLSILTSGAGTGVGVAAGVLVGAGVRGGSPVWRWLVEGTGWLSPATMVLPLPIHVIVWASQ